MARTLSRLVLFMILAAAILIALGEFSVRLFVLLSSDIKAGRFGLNYSVNDNKYGLKLNPGLRLKVRYEEHPAGTYFIHINEQGFSEDKDIPVKKEEGEYRIFVLGDSHTQGACNNIESFPNLLEACLSEKEGTNYNVINAGVGGWSFVQEYLYLTEELVKYSPDMVIVAVYMGNDLYDLEQPFGPGIKGTAPDFSIDRNLRKPFPEIAKYSYLYSFLYGRKHLKHVLGDKMLIQEMRQIEWFLDKTTAGTEEVFRKIGYIARKLKEYEKKSGVPISVILLPTKTQVEGPDAEFLTFLKNTGTDEAATEDCGRIILSGVMRAFKDADLPCIDLLEPMREAYLATGQALYYDIDRHLDPEGNKVVAGFLCRMLKLDGGNP